MFFWMEIFLMQFLKPRGRGRNPRGGGGGGPGMT